MQGDLGTEGVGQIPLKTGEMTTYGRFTGVKIYVYHYHNPRQQKQKTNQTSPSRKRTKNLHQKSRYEHPLCERNLCIQNMGC